MHLCLNQNPSAPELSQQLKWTDSIIELLFLHTGMSSFAKDSLSLQIESVIDKLKQLLSKKEEQVKNQLELAGQLEFLEENEPVLREKIIINASEGGKADGSLLKATVVL